MPQNKYSARKTVCGSGHTHDSRREAVRCNELHLMQRAGEISDLRVQVAYDLIPSMKYEDMPNERSVKYIADFVYTKDGKTIIEDTKGMQTPAYIIKRKLLKKLYCVDGKAIFVETK